MLWHVDLILFIDCQSMFCTASEVEVVACSRRQMLTSILNLEVLQ